MSKSISAKRKSISMELTFWKSIKESVKIVKSLVGNNEIVQVYKYCYPNLWKDICEYHKKMVRWNKQRVLKGKSSVYAYSSPENFLLLKSQRQGKYSLSFMKAKNYGGSQDEIKENLRERALRKLAKRNAQEQRRERYKQHMEPTYVDMHIKAYFQVRKQNPADVDTRYLIVHELAKYNCEATIRFLEQLVRSEKNLSLQHYAWESLNSFGVTGVHKGRRIGKKKLTHVKGYAPITTPRELLQAIYNSPLEQMKNYDLFLSHSYQDKDKLIELKNILNSSGLNVYMDWVNDKDELLRSMTSAETAVVITERIKSSKAILYIHTNSSLDSKWTPWELGYAYAIGKPILVYRPEETDSEPEYLQLYQSVVLGGKKLVFKNERDKVVDDWIKNI